jgi:plastocyanin
VSSETIFYVLGILLVLSAVGLAFFGLRWEGSFPTRHALLGVTGVFAVLVLATVTTSVIQAEDEQEKRQQELAEHEEQAAAEDEGPASGGVVEQESGAEVGGGALAPGSGPSEPPAGGEAPEGGAQSGSELDVTSPSDGALVFEPDGLEANAGEVTLVYENPSSVPHSIAIEDEGQQLGATQPISNDKVELSERLAPGEYVFYCTVPGHREAGMEGDLTVSGPQ